MAIVYATLPASLAPPAAAADPSPHLHQSRVFDYDAPIARTTPVAGPRVGVRRIEPQSVVRSQLSTQRISLRHAAKAAATLSDDVSATFKGGQYAARALDEDIVLQRVYGGTSPELGPYWSRTSYSNPGRAKQYLALPPGNTAERVVTIRVPAGTTIYEGKAAAHYGRRGGGNQVYITRVDPGWITGR